VQTRRMQAIYSYPTMGVWPIAMGANPDLW